MKLIILGSKGMLGQELARGFSGYDILGFEKNELDITNKSALAVRLSAERPDIVINAAAVNAVDKIEESLEFFELAKKVNSDAPRHLAEICRDINAVFVHYSSDYVFKGDDKKGYHEESAINPVNKYGETKASAEEAIKKIGGKFYLLRLSKLFGCPAASENAKKSFVDTMIWLANEGGKKILEVVDAEISSPTYAPDLVRLTKEIIETDRPRGIYHGSNSGVCSWYEFAKQIFEFKKISVAVVKVAPEKFPRSAKRPQFSELINTKLPFSRSWQTALKEYLC